MNKSEQFTVQSSPQIVLDWLTSDNVFSTMRIDEFAQTNGSSGDIYGHDSLKALLTTDLFRNRFEKQWQYETNSNWKGRTVKVAIVETVLHTLSYLALDAQLELMGKGKGKFSGLTTVQIDIMDKQSRFLNDYYRVVLKGVL